MSSSAVPSVQPAVSNDDSSAALKISGVEQLRPPGLDSNYLDWSLVIGLHLQATNLHYVLETKSPSEQNAKWSHDNIIVCSIITKTVHPANL